MPGVNCSVFGCSSCRRTKGLGIFKVPLPKDDAHKIWRDEWLGELKKTRELDQDFRRQIKEDRIYTCEKHFDPEDIKTFPSEKVTKKKVKFGALPKHSMPYRSDQDERFQFLMEFLEYLKSWKESTKSRPGNFTQNARTRMFLSWQTYEGFQLTVQSSIESTKFLLQEGMEYVLTERFCQDPAEEFFGKQRQLG